MSYIFVTDVPRYAVPPSDAEIRQCVANILGSNAFKRAKRSRELLSYLVDATLAGRASTIKAFTIAVDVFGRDQDFDADNDSLVRVHAGRLREALELYYRSQGVSDPVLIELPKGAYSLVFALRSDPQSVGSLELTSFDQPPLGR